MGFWEEAGKLLGMFWHKKGIEQGKTAASKHARIKSRTEKIYQDYIDLYTKEDPESGKTYAKILYDLKHPEWFKIKHLLPKDIFELIKTMSGITED